MENESTPESNINSTINAVAGLVKEIPIYQDTIQPAAQEVGKSLHTISKTINIALAPIKALVWGYDKIEEFITRRVSEKLANTSQENIISPDPKIAVPAIEALRYTGSDENLRELYATLIANAMDKQTVQNAHPGFVEILKNLSSDEAILLKCFIGSDIKPLLDIEAQLQDNSGYTPVKKSYSNFYQNIQLQNIDLIPSYIDNLIRLGLLEIPSGIYITEQNTYEPLENAPDLEATKLFIEQVMKRKVKFSRKVLRTTTFGSQFIRNVVADK